MERATLGDQELELLRYVTDHAPATVRDVAEQFGESHGLAKTTVQTMMERLRAKGYLERIRRDSMYYYSPAVSKGDLVRGLIQDFVQKALGGSFSPLVAYLAERKNLTAEETAVLEKVVQEIEKEEQEGKEQP